MSIVPKSMSASRQGVLSAVQGSCGLPPRAASIRPGVAINETSVPTPFQPKRDYSLSAQKPQYKSIELLSKCISHQEFLGYYERIVGRLAMLGLYAALSLELFSNRPIFTTLGPLASMDTVFGVVSVAICLASGLLLSVKFYSRSRQQATVGVLVQDNGTPVHRVMSKVLDKHLGKNVLATIADPLEHI